MTDVWGGEGEKNSSEEFPFENFINMNSGNKCILLSGTGEETLQERLSLLFL
tara:strand:+ start:423 stop:578 length:156 start_codon:yes stop_codon:yes gene_type:complete